MQEPLKLKNWEDCILDTYPSRDLVEDDFEFIPGKSILDHLVGTYLFKLARRVKVLIYNSCQEWGWPFDETVTFKPEVLQEGFEKWLSYSQGLAYRRHDLDGWKKMAERAEWLFDMFQERLLYVQVPEGLDPVTFAFKEAAGKAAPKDLRDRLAFRGRVEQSKVRLAMACRQLQKSKGPDEAWYLSQRAAADRLGISPVRTRELLRALRAAGVIELVRPGTFNLLDPSENRASFYKYCLSTGGIQLGDEDMLIMVTDSRGLPKCPRCEAAEEEVDPFDISRRRLESLPVKKRGCTDVATPEVLCDTIMLTDSRCTPCCPYAYTRWMEENCPLFKHASFNLEAPT